jgi:hypothetical protein
LFLAGHRWLLCVVAEVLAQRIAHQTLRLALAGASKSQSKSLMTASGCTRLASTYAFNSSLFLCH